MPPFNEYRCDYCDFRLPSGYGGCGYVTDQDGTRILLLHPIEDSILRRVLGADAPDDLIEQRTGFISNCLCLDCLENLELDLQRDVKICPKCKSDRVASLHEMVDEKCPKCQVGIIREIQLGIS